MGEHREAWNRPWKELMVLGRQMSGAQGLWAGLRAVGGAEGCGRGSGLWAGLGAVGGAQDCLLGVPQLGCGCSHFSSRTHSTPSSRSSPGGRGAVCLTCPGPLLGQGPQDRSFE